MLPVHIFVYSCARCTTPQRRSGPGGSSLRAASRGHTSMSSPSTMASSQTGAGGNRVQGSTRCCPAVCSTNCACFSLERLIPAAADLQVDRPRVQAGCCSHVAAIRCTEEVVARLHAGRQHHPGRLQLPCRYSIHCAHMTHPVCIPESVENENVACPDWCRYLDYVEAKGDVGMTVRMFERCLVACANYPGRLQLLSSSGAGPFARYCGNC